MVGVWKVTSLPNFPRQAEAQAILEQVAAQVQPICAAEGRAWKVFVAEEFFPADPGLLGMNRGQGQTINIRLRPANDRTSFLPYHDILGTMLHELVHMEIGPHNAAFYAMFDKLWGEVEALQDRGIDGRSRSNAGGVWMPTGSGGPAGNGSTGRPQSAVPVGAGHRLGGNRLASSSYSASAATTGGNKSAVRQAMVAAAERRQRLGRLMGSGASGSSTASSNGVLQGAGHVLGSKRRASLGPASSSSILPSIQSSPQAPQAPQAVLPRGLEGRRALLARAAERRMRDDAACANGWRGAASSTSGGGSSNNNRGSSAPAAAARSLAGSREARPTATSTTSAAAGTGAGQQLQQQGRHQPYPAHVHPIVDLIVIDDDGQESTQRVEGPEVAGVAGAQTPAARATDRSSAPRSRAASSASAAATTTGPASTSTTRDRQAASASSIAPRHVISIDDFDDHDNLVDFNGVNHEDEMLIQQMLMQDLKLQLQQCQQQNQGHGGYIDRPSSGAGAGSRAATADRVMMELGDEEDEVEDGYDDGAAGGHGLNASDEFEGIDLDVDIDGNDAAAIAHRGSGDERASGRRGGGRKGPVVCGCGGHHDDDHNDNHDDDYAIQHHDDSAAIPHAHAHDMDGDGVEEAVGQDLELGDADRGANGSHHHHHQQQHDRSLTDETTAADGERLDVRDNDGDVVVVDDSQCTTAVDADGDDDGGGDGGYAHTQPHHRLGNAAGAGGSSSSATWSATGASAAGTAAIASLSPSPMPLASPTSYTCPVCTYRGDSHGGLALACEVCGSQLTLGSGASSRGNNNSNGIIADGSFSAATVPFHAAAGGTGPAAPAALPVNLLAWQLRAQDAQQQLQSSHR